MPSCWVNHRRLRTDGERQCLGRVHFEDLHTNGTDRGVVDVACSAPFRLGGSRWHGRLLLRSRERRGGQCTPYTEQPCEPQEVTTSDHRVHVRVALHLQNEYLEGDLDLAGGLGAADDPKAELPRVPFGLPQFTQLNALNASILNCT